MVEWAEQFEHAGVTADNREAFNTAMDKFPTMGDAAVGYMELQKSAGKPFKIPESMENLPDDASRTEFSTQALKALGIEHAGSIEDLADLDIKAGMAEGAEANEDFANSFKQFVVDSKISKANAQKLLSFHNESQLAAQTAFLEKQETDRVATAEQVNKDLAVALGGDEKVAEMSELFKRTFTTNKAFMAKMGITPENSEKIGDAIAKSGLTTDPDLARIMLKTFAPLSAEGTSIDGIGGTPPPKVETVKDQLPKTGAALNWK
jgi:hypothetical protein